VVFLVALLWVEGPQLATLDRWLLAASCPSRHQVDPVDELCVAYHLPGRAGALWHSVTSNEALEHQELFTILPQLILQPAVGLLQPVLAYNITMVAAALAAALLAALLVRRLVGRWDSAVLGGLLFGMSPLAVSVYHCNSLDYGLLALLPLCVLALLEAARRPGLLRPLLAGLAMAALALSSPLQALGLLVVGALALLAWGVVPGDEPGGRWRPVGRLLGAGVLSLALIAPLVSPLVRNLADQRSGASQMLIAQTPMFGSFWMEAGALASSPWTVLVVVLGLVGALVPGTMGRRPRLVLGGTSLILLLAVGLVAAFPDQLVPLLRDTPLLWRARRPDLLLLWPSLGLAVLASAGVAVILRRGGPRLAWGLWAVVVPLVLWALVAARPTPTAPLATPASLAPLVDAHPAHATWLVFDADVDSEANWLASLYPNLWQSEPRPEDLVDIREQLRDGGRSLERSGGRRLEIGLDKGCTRVLVRPGTGGTVTVDSDRPVLETTHPALPVGWQLFSTAACGG